MPDRGPSDKARARAAISEFLSALGFDPKAPELLDTPDRVTEAFGEELLSGYGVDVAELLRSGGEAAGDRVLGPVFLERIRVVTVCPHHLLLAEGWATLGYDPGSWILGLGTLSRLVDAMSRRLVLQEAIAGSVCDALMTHAGARGAYCRLTLNHACLRARGPEQIEASATTWAARGTLEGTGGMLPGPLPSGGRFG